MFDAFFNSPNRLAEILPVHEKPSQEENPNIKKGNQEQFFFTDKAHRTTDERKQEHYVKDTPVVAYETHGTVFGYIFHAARLKLATREFKEKQRPSLGDTVNEYRQRAFSPQETQQKVEDAYWSEYYERESHHKEYKDRFQPR
jgi:hypothetical protein